MKVKITTAMAPQMAEINPVSNPSRLLTFWTVMPMIIVATATIQLYTDSIQQQIAATMPASKMLIPKPAKNPTKYLAGLTTSGIVFPESDCSVCCRVYCSIVLDVISLTA